MPWAAALHAPLWLDPKHGPRGKLGPFYRSDNYSDAGGDFGTGYSSLAYLRRLPIDVLKVDRSFVHNAVRDSVDAEIVRTIVALARALRLRVVAEGVETEDQAEFLRSSGCEQAQGYLYAKPMPAEQLAEWMHAAQPQTARAD